MLDKRIIPCLDVRDGKVVKGINFVGIKEVGDPVQCAEEYNRQGADEIVFLDITATHEHRGTMADVVRKTAEKVFVPLTVGGGIRTIDDFQAMLRAGADKVSVNSAALRRPELIAEAADKFGSSVSSLRLTPKRCRTAIGTPTSPAAGRIPASTRSSGRNRRCPSGRGKSSSPRWTRTAPKWASTCRC